MRTLKETDVSIKVGRDCPEVLAIIPARSGSKGIFCKNIKPLCGKPLISYTIDVAVKAANISKVVVSTDDDNIAAVAREFGAEVPFLRPKEIAGDTVPLDRVGHHTLSELAKQSYIPQVCVWMYPTHPFRRLSTVEMLIEKLTGYYNEITVYKQISKPRLPLFYQNKDNRLGMLMDGGIDPREYRYMRPSGYLHGKKLIPNEDPFAEYAHCLDDPVEGIDIDSHTDFDLARKIVENKLYPFPE